MRTAAGNHGSDYDKKYVKTDKGRRTVARKRYREWKQRLKKRIKKKEQQILDLERELGNVQENRD